MGAGQVDDERVGGRLEGGRLVVVEAQEEDVGAACGGLGIRHEGRQGAVKSRIERLRGLPGERVRAERDRLERGVREQAIEGLLAGIAGAAEDGGGVHPA